MSRFGAQYQVSRHTGVCAHTGEAIRPGEACIATLCERPDDDGFERLDFSCSAWEAGARPPGLFSYWKSIVPEPGAKRNVLIDDSVLMDLFERLAEDDRPQRLAFRFVLGLILMRKKLLKLTGRVEREESSGRAERWLVQQRGADPASKPIELINPELADADVRDLTDQLGEVLQSEL